MNKIAAAAIVVAAATGCATDRPDQRVPNPPHGMPGHDHTRMHTPAPTTADVNAGTATSAPQFSERTTHAHERSPR